MKNTVILSAEDLKNAALHLLLSKPQFHGKHCAAVEFIFDKSDPEPMRQIRIECVLFDTAKGAARYLENGDDIEQPDHPAAGSGEVTNATDNLEGELHGNGKEK
jgi:hypothetical protein